MINKDLLNAQTNIGVSEEKESSQISSAVPTLCYKLICRSSVISLYILSHPIDIIGNEFIYDYVVLQRLPPGDIIRESTIWISMCK